MKFDSLIMITGMLTFLGGLFAGAFISEKLGMYLIAIGAMLVTGVLIWTGFSAEQEERKEKEDEEKII